MKNDSRLSVDPLAKVAECNRVIERIADPERRVVLESLRSFWVALSEELPLDHARDRANQLSTVAQIHTQLIAGCRRAMH